MDMTTNDLDNDVTLHGLYTRLKQESYSIDINPKDKNNQPSRRQLKKEGLKYFNKTSLTDQYIRYNEPDTVSLSTTLWNDVIKKLQTGLRKHHRFRGEFFQVGSFYDGTKVKLVNEFDCMFVCDGSHYKLKKVVEDGILYKLYNRHTHREVDAGDQRTALADAINDLAEGLDLPKGLVHGGFASPEFSGVRINKPAVTLLFIWTPPEERLKPVPQRIPLSLDITLALSVPSSLEEAITENVWNVIDPVRSDSQVNVQIDLEGQLHFIPVADDSWNITSTLLEANILRHVPDVPIKRCIKLAKIIVYDQIAKPDLCQEYDNKMYSPEDIQEWQKQIELQLERYTKKSRKKNKAKRLRVQELLRHGHVLLTPGVSKEYGEMRRPSMAVVSAAIKHLTLKTFCDTPAYHMLYDGVEFDLLVDVFKSLGDLEHQTVKHFLLPEHIKMVSIAPYAQHEAASLIRHVKFECKRLGKRLNGTNRFDSLTSYFAQKKLIFFLLGLLVLFLALGVDRVTYPMNLSATVATS